MKDCIEKNYGILSEGIIQITQKVYKVKTSQGFLALKYCENQDVETIYQSISTLGLRYFVPLMINKEGHYVSYDHQRPYYLMPWIENDDVLLKELKLKFYFEVLVYLHQQTFYHVSKKQASLDRLCEDITKTIQERERYYASFMHVCECNPYRSPSEWMLLMNYCRFQQSLFNASQYLQQYQEISSHKEQVRVSFVYMNFDYDHICLKHKMLLSFDKMMIHMPIYDLFYLFQKTPDCLFDLESLSYHYLKHIELFEDEKVLLCCLLSIIPLIEFSEDEIDNVIRLSRLNYYLDATQHLIKQILGK